LKAASGAGELRLRGCRVSAYPRPRWEPPNVDERSAFRERARAMFQQLDVPEDLVGLEKW